VAWDGREVKLTATEFRLLHYLASHPGRVFTREQLLDRALGDNVVVVDRNIDVHIRGIRKKLGVEPPPVETVRGVGYRMAERPEQARTTVDYLRTRHFRRSFATGAVFILLALLLRGLWQARAV